MAEGVWRTINGARVFIKSGQSLESAMADAGFKTGPNGTPRSAGRKEHLKEQDFENMKDFSNTKDALYNYLEGGADKREGTKEAKLINDFIDNNPEYHWAGKPLYRAVFLEEEFVSPLEKGAIIDQKGYSSWTDDTTIINSYVDDKSGFLQEAQELRGVKLTPVVFVDRTKGIRSAISVSAISPYGEDEVLYSGRAKFKVTSTKTRGNVLYVDVEEVG